MCGITGFCKPASTPSSDFREIIEGMTATLQHRGPDDQGVWVDEHAGIALGHRRLSILDLSPEGHQPMASTTGRYVIVFNGEIYNFNDLRADLHIPFRGHSDTEVMLAAFEKWGVERALCRFNGMFAFALWDRQTRALTLARDRLGEKPLYYGWTHDVFLFGSELKALRAHPVFDNEIDRDALALFLRHNYIPAPYSIYRGIWKLPPGTYLRIAADNLTSQMPPVPYWSARAAAEQGLRNPVREPDEESAQRLDALLKDSVKIRMAADVPLGALLSGGIDSSSIVALMQAQSTLPVKTFTIGYHERSYNEAVYAAEVARHLGTDHTELYVTPDEAREVIPELPALYDEPFADSSQIPTYLVSKLARQYVTVGLSGDGGDELFGGYTRYSWCQRIWNSVRWMPQPARWLAGNALRGISSDQWNAVFDCAAALVPQESRQSHPGDKLHKLGAILKAGGPEAMYLELVSYWRRPDSVVLGSFEPGTHLTDRSRWISAGITEKMMFLDMVSYLPDDILAKTDRASMGVGLEVRVPFLDHRIVEFAWRLPLSKKVRRGQGKWLLRQVLHKYVPQRLVERPKIGFGVPVYAWLRGPLRDWAEDLLHASRLRQDGFFDPEPIQRKWREHLSGKHNWMDSLWGILMFQAWLASQKCASPLVTQYAAL